MKQQLPSYPLFIKDPYFSFYSNGELLNDSDVTFWTGCPRVMLGLLKVDRKIYSFLGKSNLTKLEQIDIEISTFKTTYTFRKDDFEFVVSFVSILPLDDLDLLSIPLCYMSYEFKSSNEHEIEVSLCLNENWLYNDVNKPLLNGIRGESFTFKDYQISTFRGNRQFVLGQSCDEFLPEQGSFFLMGEKSYFIDQKSLDSYLENRFEISNDGDNKYLLALSKNKRGIISIGKDDYFSLQYFDEALSCYYFRNGKNIFDAFSYLYKNIDKIEEKLSAFDLDLKEKCKLVSHDYYKIAVASYRQSVGAHKLGITKDNELVFISKECGSNGCAATVDVTYPTSPLLYLYNPALLQASLKPIFDFAAMPVWKYGFAPHDAGKYPTLVGQIYAYKFDKKSPYDNYDNIFTFPSNADVYDFKYQMPVEESANMIILSYGLYFYSKKFDYVKKNYKLLKKWATYLLKNGLIPTNQLCTDDFSGRLDKNVNLSIKSTIAVRCFYEIAKKMKDKKAIKEFKACYKDFASHIEKISKELGYLPLTYLDNDNRYSLKYNLAFDKAFRFNLFSDELYQREFNEYKKHYDLYGTPLDPRSDYVKADWSMWVASFADEPLKNELIKQTIYFLENSKARYAFPDWYRSTNGEIFTFKNRTVVGGNFLPLLVKLK